MQPRPKTFKIKKKFRNGVLECVLPSPVMVPNKPHHPIAITCTKSPKQRLSNHHNTILITGFYPWKQDEWRTRKGVWKLSKVGGWWMSIRGERRGSTFLRNRSAISTLPSHESERATKRGTTAMAHEGATCLVLRPPLLPGLEGSVRDSDVEGSSPINLQPHSNLRVSLSVCVLCWASGSLPHASSSSSPRLAKLVMPSRPISIPHTLLWVARLKWEEDGRSMLWRRVNRNEGEREVLGLMESAAWRMMK